MPTYSFAHLSDAALRRDLQHNVATERGGLATQLALIAEVDARQLYLPDGYPSMFAWCVGELRFSEDEAYKRIRVARAGREHPAIFPSITDGRLNVSAILLLAPHLASGTADELLAAAANQTRTAIERLIAERAPRPDVPTLITPLPGAVHVPPPVTRVQQHETKLAPGRVESPLPVRVAALSPQRYALQVTIDQEAHDLLTEARDLLGHAVAAQDMNQVLKRALKLLVGHLKHQKFAACSRPRPRRSHANRRYVPAEIKREVYRRDGGRCTFVSENGHRCESRTRLEFDHVEPVARGGHTTAANLRLRCRAHNQFEAERKFGKGFMEARRRKVAGA